MILKKLFITAEIQCPFHVGLNIILGTKVPKKKHNEQKTIDTNGVGKTTIIDCVRFALGHSVSHLVNLKFFQEKKYWVHLEISIENKSKVLLRPLWNPLSDDLVMIYDGSLEEFQDTLIKNSLKMSDALSLDDLEKGLVKLDKIKKYSIEEYNSILSQWQYIDYSQSNIKFSSILDYLIRDEKNGYSDIISMPRRTEWVQYRTMQYLLGLPANIENETAKVKDDIQNKQSEFDLMSKELTERRISSIDSIVNRRITCQKQLKQVREQLSSVVVTPSLENVRKEYQESRTNLLNLNKELHQNEMYLQSHKLNLNNLKDKENSLVALLNVEKFYKDLVGFFPDQVKDNFNQYNEFFSNVGSDRKVYYEELIGVLEKQSRELKAKRKSIQDQLDILSSRFSSTSIVTDVAAMASREESIKRDLLDLDKMETYLIKSESVAEEIEGLKKKRDGIIKKGKEIEKESRHSREELITSFKDWVDRIYKTDEGTLEFSYNQNPTSSIVGRTEVDCYIPAKNSHGRGYAMIVLFDLVWFLRSRTRSEFNPSFLVHDGPYVIISDEAKPKILDLILELLSDKTKQYILTANDGDLIDLEKYRQYVCIELDGSSDRGKFLKEPFSDRVS